MKADWNEKEEKVLAELDELKYTGGWHKIRIEVLKKYAAEVSRETIEECKKTLLKQLHPMIYRINTYPCEAVSKAVILSLDKLVKEQEG